MKNKQVIKKGILKTTKIDSTFCSNNDQDAKVNNIKTIFNGKNSLFFTKKTIKYSKTTKMPVPKYILILVNLGKNDQDLPPKWDAIVMTKEIKAKALRMTKEATTRFRGKLALCKFFKKEQKPFLSERFESVCYAFS